MSRDKDSGLVFPFLPGHTKFLSLKHDMENRKPKVVRKGNVAMIVGVTVGVAEVVFKVENKI